MQAETYLLNDSLIAVRCAVVDPFSSVPFASDPGTEEFQPRLCCVDAGLTSSGGDFGFFAAGPDAPSA